MSYFYLKHFPFDSALLRTGGVTVDEPGATTLPLKDGPWELQPCRGKKKRRKRKGDKN